MIRRRPATGLPDDVVARCVVWCVMLRGDFDLDDAVTAIRAATWAHAAGDIGWPHTIDDVADALADRRIVHLWPLSYARSVVPSGAA